MKGGAIRTGCSLGGRLKNRMVRDSKITLHHLLSESVRRHGNLASHVDLYADKGYDSEHCRSACRAQGLNAQIPRRRTPSIWG